jgi:hypothetical protein
MKRKKGKYINLLKGAFPNETETEIEKLLIDNNNLEETYRAIEKTNEPDKESDLSQLMSLIDSEYDFDTLFQLYELKGSIEGVKEWI